MGDYKRPFKSKVSVEREKGKRGKGGRNGGRKEKRREEKRNKRKQVSFSGTRLKEFISI